MYACRAQPPVDSNPFNEWISPGGGVWTGFYRIENGYMLRFPCLADFGVSDTGIEIVAHPVPGVSAATVQHLYSSQVLPLALSRQGELVLHASAVEVDDSVLAFLGTSGRGKSTLAASFTECGHRIVTDDGLQLQSAADGYLALPGHPSIRLLDDSRRLAGDNLPFRDSSCPIRCMYFLGEGVADSVAIESVSGRDAMIELVRHSFLLDVEEKTMLARHFSQLTLLVSRPIFFRLDYPRNFEVLPAVREAVLAHSGSI